MSINNSNGSRIEVNGHPHIIQEETHSFQFRGVLLPAPIVQMIADGKISRRKLTILIIVEALVNPDGEGCYATNRYISRNLGVSPMRVSQLIQELKSQGLLITYEKIRNGRHQRYMETCWSRGGISNSDRGGISNSDTPPISAGDTINIRCNSNGYKKKGCGGPPAPPAPFGLRPDRPSHILKHHLQYASRLKAIIEHRHRIGWNQPTHDSWAEVFYQIEKKIGKEELEDILHFYEKNPLHRYTINSPAQFLKPKILRIVREILKKTKEKNTVRRIDQWAGPIEKLPKEQQW